MNFAARITGTGSAFPKNRVTNDDIVQKLAGLGVTTSDQWIRERTGICERRISDNGNPSEYNSSLGLSAAQNALEMAGKTADEINQIIYATSPYINAACSGFIYGLSTAEKFIRTGQVKTALVVGAEVLNPIIDWEDRNSCILFGDGAGAVVVERVHSSSSHRIIDSRLRSDGHLWELLHIPAGGSNMELTPERYARKLNKIKMKGKEIFKIAVKTLCDFAQNLLRKNQLTPEDLDWFVPHQANRRIIEAVANRLQLPMEKVLVNVDRYGNTSSATIPTVLDEAIRDGRIKSGQTILLDAFGAGLTYGAMLIRW